jgi:hypothetical protein
MSVTLSVGSRRSRRLAPPMFLWSQGAPAFPGLLTMAEPPADVVPVGRAHSSGTGKGGSPKSAGLPSGSVVGNAE